MAINQGPEMLPPRQKVYIEGSRKASMSVKEKNECSLPFSASAQADLRCFEEEKDHSSPRGVIEACIRDFDHEPADDTSSNNSSTEFRSSSSRSSSSWRKFFKLWKGRTVKRLPSFPPFGSTMSRRKSVTSIRNVAAICSSGWKSFTLSELVAATNNFSEDNLIGKGGFAEVFKGCLPDGQLVAIKRLNKGSPEEQSINFLSEIGIIAHVHHPNTAKMIGFGVEGGTYLVLQLSSLGSLGTLLHGSESKLPWDARYKIILGTANGLLYLHENCQRRIIHRDIKADNILLTEDFEPQICDFGLAKWLPEQWTHHNVSKFEGTFGYFAPEYITDGIVDEKTDVFAFGVLLLELVTRKKPVDETQKSLVLWAKPLLDSNDLEMLVDPTLCNDYDREEMDRVILVASLCIEHDPILRPTMSKVVNLLKGNDVHLECPREDQKMIIQRTFSEEILDVEDYNFTKCLRAIQPETPQLTASSSNLSSQP